MIMLSSCYAKINEFNKHLHMTYVTRNIYFQHLLTRL